MVLYLIVAHRQSGDGMLMCPMCTPKQATVSTRAPSQPEMCKNLGCSANSSDAAGERKKKGKRGRRVGG